MLVIEYKYWSLKVTFNSKIVVQIIFESHWEVELSIWTEEFENVFKLMLSANILNDIAGREFTDEHEIL